jgi:hypothetical protein
MSLVSLGISLAKHPQTAHTKLPPEDEDADGIEVAWGELHLMLQTASYSPAEDQQRINTFSKLNNRLSDLQDQLKAKQVSLTSICDPAPWLMTGGKRLLRRPRDRIGACR